MSAEEIMENGEKVVRLAKPVKKGLLHLVFSRFFVFVLLLAAQVVLFAAIYIWFAESMHIFLYAQWIFAFLMILYLFNCDMDSSAKLTWMLVISIVPTLGAMLLLWTQLNFGHRTLTEQAKEQIDKTKGILEQPEDVVRQVENDGSGTDDLSKYLNNSGCYPLYDKTKVTYFDIGEKKFEAMLEQMEKAEKFIFMEYFIVEEGYMWDRLLACGSCTTACARYRISRTDTLSCSKPRA